MPMPCRIAKGRAHLNAVARICTLILLSALCLGVLQNRGAYGQVDDVYTVAGVAVDETAETAAVAREQALAAGHRIAFSRLVSRLVPRAERNRVPALDAGRVAPFVLSFGIDEEKTSDVRYLGTLTFRFRRDAIRTFLQDSGVGFAETRSKPVLLLPVYDNAGALMLWEEPNPWFEAWRTLSPSDGLVPLRLPAGDLADIRDIGAEQAARGETERFRVIMDRYGASAVTVAEAELTFDASSGQRSIDVATRRYGGVGGERTSVRSFVIDPGEGVEAVLARAGRAVATPIEEDWKSENLLRFDLPNDLIAVIALSDLREWVEIRNRLRAIAFLRQVRMVSASRRQIVVQLGYYGDPEQLRVALAQRVGDLVDPRCHPARRRDAG